MNALSKSLNETFRKLVMELEKARFEDVPTYAPKAFKKALECYKHARQKFADFESPDEINRELDQFFENLKKARVVAKATEELLSEVVKARGEINKNEQVRYRSPEKLNQAEQAYLRATEQAEEGETKAARKSATTALYLYRDAKLTAVEGGLIRNLENRLKDTQNLLEPQERDKALAVLSSLESDLDQARAGDLDASRLTDKVAAAGNKIGSLLRLNTGFGPGSDLSDRVFDPGPPGWAPGTFGPPPAPVTMRITNRTDNTLTLTWRNITSNTDTNIIERREGDGPWEAVAELGVLGEWQTYTDGGLGVLLPDRLYCYRIRARNAFGSTVTPPDKQACGYTRDGNNLTLGRVQLQIRVADIPYAGSHDSVNVRLSSPLATYSPSGNNTWLDYGPDYSISGGSLIISDDFDRGREFTYDLNLTFLAELSDITMISIRKDGGDALAIAEIALIVNGVVVFDRFFGGTSSTAQWIDGDSPIFTIFHPELRAHDNWPTLFPGPVLHIPNQELVDRLEGIIGDQIHGTPLEWGQSDGNDWVEITHVDASTLHVTVDLVVEIPGPNLELDIEFDLNVSIVCLGTQATLMLTTSNFDSHVNFNILHDILTLGIVEFFDDNIERAIQAMWQPIARSFDVTSGGLCPVVEVDQDGNLDFRLS